MDLEAYWHPTDNWSFESSLLYRIFDRDLFGAGQDMALLNLSLSRLLFAGLGNLQLAFSDVLNRSQGVTITNGATYYEEARVVSLCRNAMLNFTYKPSLMKRRRYAPYLNRAAGIVGCTWRNSSVSPMPWTVNPVHGHDMVVELGGVHLAPSRARIGVVVGWSTGFLHQWSRSTDDHLSVVQGTTHAINSRKRSRVCNVL